MKKHSIIFITVFLSSCVTSSIQNSLLKDNEEVIIDNNFEILEIDENEKFLDFLENDWTKTLNENQRTLK